MFVICSYECYFLRRNMSKMLDPHVHHCCVASMSEAMVKWDIQRTENNSRLPISLQASVWKLLYDEEPSEL